jgi:hypothetical protein
MKEKKFIKKMMKIQKLGQTESDTSEEEDDAKKSILKEINGKKSKVQIVDGKVSMKE